MGKRFKVLVVAALTAVMMFSALPTAAAGLAEAGQVVDGSVLTAETSVEDTKFFKTKGNILATGTAKLSNQGDSKVAITGITVCHLTCDQVICNVYLEQLSDDGFWNNYDYWNYSKTDAVSLAKTKVVKVPGGHWYRARGGHMAIKGKEIESITTATNGIWID